MNWVQAHINQDFRADGNEVNQTSSGSEYRRADSKLFAARHGILFRESLIIQVSPLIRLKRRDLVDPRLSV